MKGKVTTYVINIANPQDELIGIVQLFRNRYTRLWEEEKYHNVRGTYPVISLSFAGVK